MSDLSLAALHAQRRRLEAQEADALRATLHAVGLDVEYLAPTADGRWTLTVGVRASGAEHARAEAAPRDHASVSSASVTPMVADATEIAPASGTAAAQGSAENSVSQPVLAEPVADKPVADKPVADEPVADEPVADEPVADEPVADEPVADEPVADEPVADEPVADEPVVESPALNLPVVPLVPLTPAAPARASQNEELDRLFPASDTPGSRSVGSGPISLGPTDDEPMTLGSRRTPLASPGGLTLPELQKPSRASAPAATPAATNSWDDLLDGLELPPLSLSPAGPDDLIGRPLGRDATPVPPAEDPLAAFDALGPVATPAPPAIQAPAVQAPAVQAPAVQAPVAAQAAVNVEEAEEAAVARNIEQLHAMSSRGELRVSAEGKRQNPFRNVSTDPSARAARLARTLVSDMRVYRPDDHALALAEGLDALRAAFSEDIKKARERYYEQVPPGVVADRDQVFRDAVNELLGNNQPVLAA